MTTKVLTRLLQCSIYAFLLRAVSDHATATTIYFDLEINNTTDQTLPVNGSQWYAVPTVHVSPYAASGADTVVSLGACSAHTPPGNSQSTYYFYSTFNNQDSLLAALTTTNNQVNIPPVPQDFSNYNFTLDTSSYTKFYNFPPQIAPTINGSLQSNHPTLTWQAAGDLQFTAIQVSLYNAATNTYIFNTLAVGAHSWTPLQTLGSGTWVFKVRYIGGYVGGITASAAINPNGHTLTGWQGLTTLTAAVSDSVKFSVPTVPTPRMTVEPVGSGSFRLSFLTNTNVTYQLQRSNNLTGWTDVGAPLSGDGTIKTVTDTNVQSWGYWRLRMQY